MTDDWHDYFPTFISRVITANLVMWEMRLNIVDRGLFQDSDIAGDLEDSKSTSGGVLSIFGSRTFVPISISQLHSSAEVMSVPYSSTESEILSLDAGLRIDGLPALDLWDLVIEVLRTTHGIPKPTQACTRETGVEIQSTPKIKRVLDQNVDLSNMD